MTGNFPMFTQPVPEGGPLPCLGISLGLSFYRSPWPLLLLDSPESGSRSTDPSQPGCGLSILPLFISGDSFIPFFGFLICPLPGYLFQFPIAAVPNGIDMVLKKNTGALSYSCGGQQSEIHPTGINQVSTGLYFFWRL
jgi:hypothetical protein